MPFLMHRMQKTKLRDNMRYNMPLHSLPLRGMIYEGSSVSLAFWARNALLFRNSNYHELPKSLGVHFAIRQCD